MAERFQRLFALSNGYYTEGCPIAIIAGALLKDNETDRVLAQLKMQNIGDRQISSCKITVKAYENNGNETSGVKGFSYLDLTIDPGQMFGAQTPVFLPNKTTRSFSVVVEEIVFSDKTVLTVQRANWIGIPVQEKLQDKLNDPEFVKQYQLEIGAFAQYVPKRAAGLFLCTCGTPNLDTNHTCCKCGSGFDSVLNALGKDYLSTRITERLAEETEKEMNAKYEHALKLLEQKDARAYTAAIAELVTLGGWKDSVDIIERSREEIIRIEQEEKKRPYPKGLVGALIGALIGAVVFLIIWRLNLVGIITSVLILLLAALGYNKTAKVKARSFTTKEKLACYLISAFVIILAVWIGTTMDLKTYYYVYRFYSFSDLFFHKAFQSAYGLMSNTIKCWCSSGIALIVWIYAEKIHVLIKSRLKENQSS